MNCDLTLNESPRRERDTLRPTDAEPVTPVGVLAQKLAPSALTDTNLLRLLASLAAHKATRDAAARQWVRSGMPLNSRLSIEIAHEHRAIASLHTQIGILVATHSCVETVEVLQ